MKLYEVGAGYRRADPQGRLSRRRAPAIGARNQQAAPGQHHHGPARLSAAGKPRAHQDSPPIGLLRDSARWRARPAGGQADTARPIAISSPVDVSRLVLSTLRTISQGHAIPLGSPYPDPAGFAFDKLGRYAHAASKDASLNELRNALPQDTPAAAADRAAPPGPGLGRRSGRAHRHRGRDRGHQSVPAGRGRAGRRDRGGNAHLLRDAARHRAHGHESGRGSPPIRSWASTWTCLPGWPASYPSPPAW